MSVLRAGFGGADRSGFHYHYSTYQFEYSRNLIFASGDQMSQVMEGLVDRNRVRMDMKMLKTILGRKERPHRRKGRKLADWHVTVERPSYDLTIFKLHCGKLALKIYTKGERVLRTEAMALNVEALKCGRLVEKFAVSVQRLRAILERFLEACRAWTDASSPMERWTNYPLRLLSAERASEASTSTVHGCSA